MSSDNAYAIAVIIAAATSAIVAVIAAVQSWNNGTKIDKVHEQTNGLISQIRQQEFDRGYQAGKRSGGYPDESNKPAV